ncbi:MAG: tripartite tricarboxylate transporter substrate binding protein, partial [Pseudomonadota bacterium]
LLRVKLPGKVVSTNGVVVAPFIMKGLTYSIERDLAPIGSLVFSHIVVVGTTAIEDTNLAQYITAAGIGKGRSIGVPDPFATLVATRLKLATGKPLNLIPYKGAGQVTNDLVGGQVDAGIMSVVSASTLMRAGKLRGLAVLAEERSPAHPEIPTADELGITGVRTPLWVSVFAAGTTPAPVQQQLHRDLRQVMSDPAVQAKVREMGAVLSKESLEEFRDRFNREIEETRQLVKAAGLTAE